jgi:hypothetical protein
MTDSALNSALQVFAIGCPLIEPLRSNGRVDIQACVAPSALRATADHCPVLNDLALLAGVRLTVVVEAGLQPQARDQHLDNAKTMKATRLVGA